MTKTEIMTTQTNTTTFYTWRTSKLGSVYTGRVIKVTCSDVVLKDGTYTTTEVVKAVSATSRAKAKATAIKWMRYFKTANA